MPASVAGVVQREAFRAHVALAKELGLVLQIHDRDAHDEVVEVLLADGAPERTVFHCFSGDGALAEVCAEHGWYLSFAGPVGYPASADLREALRATPLDRVLLETDAPYLPPHPHRGRPNGPYLVALTAAQVADELGWDLARPVRPGERGPARSCTGPGERVPARSDRRFARVSVGRPGGAGPATTIRDRVRSVTVHTTVRGSALAGSDRPATMPAPDRTDRALATATACDRRGA